MKVAIGGHSCEKVYIDWCEYQKVPGGYGFMRVCMVKYDCKPENG